MSKARSTRVDARIWDDERFNKLSYPNGRILWFYVMCNPNAKAFPGLYTETYAEMAKVVNIPVAATRAAFKEILQFRLAFTDQKTALIWVPNALKYNHPNSPLQIAHWLSCASSFSACQLRTHAVAVLGHYCEFSGNRGGNIWSKAFHEAVKICFSKSEAVEIQEEMHSIDSKELMTNHDGYEANDLTDQFLEGYRQGISFSNKNENRKCLSDTLSISTLSTKSTPSSTATQNQTESDPNQPRRFLLINQELISSLTDDSRERIPENKPVENYKESDLSGSHNIRYKNEAPSIAPPGTIERLKVFSQQVRDMATDTLLDYSMRVYGCLPNLDKHIIQETAFIIASTIEEYGEEAYRRWKEYYKSPPAGHARNLPPWHVRRWLGLEPKNVTGTMSQLGGGSNDRKTRLEQLQKQRKEKKQ